MPVNVNCKMYGDGKCGHPAAPKTFLGGKPSCVLTTGDPRTRNCGVQVVHLQRPMKEVSINMPPRGR